MSSADYTKDLKDIKELMQKSSRFLRWTIYILAGLYALTGAFISYQFFFPKSGYLVLQSWNFKMVIVIAVSVIVLSVVTAFH